MKILIIAPQPFYRPRGTPIAIDLLVRALSERGDNVDILTFHEGDDRSYEGCTIRRIRPFFRVKEIRPGLSAKKIYCDFHLFFRFVHLIRKKRYDLVHAVEEGAFMALLVCGMKSVPFIYDMDSSMATQIVDKFRFLRPGVKLFEWMESLPMRYADTVVPMCDALAQDAFRAGAKRVVVLKDISLLETQAEQNNSISLKGNSGCRQKIAMYIGNLESYQGIDLLMESFALVCAEMKSVTLVIIGGSDADIIKYRKKAKMLGIGEAVLFLGLQPIEDLGGYMVQADILVSARTEGVNTPMKIYSYLNSGVPVLATDLPTHTQVMNKHIAMLAAPEKIAFSQAMLKLFADELLCAALANRAKTFIEQEHVYASFKATVHKLYDGFEQRLNKVN